MKIERLLNYGVDKIKIKERWVAQLHKNKEIKSYLICGDEGVIIPGLS